MMLIVSVIRIIFLNLSLKVLLRDFKGLKLRLKEIYLLFHLLTIGLSNAGLSNNLNYNDYVRFFSNSCVHDPQRFNSPKTQH